MQGSTEREAKGMKTWEAEIQKAVVAGEREFGQLDAHQTVRHNLIRRCEEILAEPLQSAAIDEHSDLLTEDETH